MWQIFIPKLIQLWKDGRFAMDKLMRNYSLRDINPGFEDSANGTVIKPVIEF
jgi:aryl-alcohol dehydrogenase